MIQRSVLVSRTAPFLVLIHVRHRVYGRAKVSILGHAFLKWIWRLENGRITTKRCVNHELTYMTFPLAKSYPVSMPRQYYGCPRAVDTRVTKYLDKHGPRIYVAPVLHGDASVICSSQSLTSDCFLGHHLGLFASQRISRLRATAFFGTDVLRL